MNEKYFMGKYQRRSASIYVHCIMMCSISTEILHSLKINLVLRDRRFPQLFRRSRVPWTQRSTPSRNGWVLPSIQCPSMAGEHEWILLDAYECPTASATISAGGDAPNMSHGTEYYVHNECTYSISARKYIKRAQTYRYNYITILLSFISSTVFNQNTTSY